jgi:hypothetical protein
MVAGGSPSAHRSANASLAPSATNAPAKARRIHVSTRGRAMTWRRTDAAQSPYPTNTTKVSSMNTPLSTSMCSSGCGSSPLTNCGRKAKKKIDSFGLRMLIRMA